MTLSTYLRTGTDASWRPKHFEPISGVVQARIIDIQDTILDEYKDKAMELAHYKKSPDGRIYGEISSCRGVWAIASNRKKCEKELREVLSEWIELKLKDKDRDIPVVSNIDINFLSLSVVSSKTNS